MAGKLVLRDQTGCGAPPAFFCKSAMLRVLWVNTYGQSNCRHNLRGGSSLRLIDRNTTKQTTSLICGKHNHIKSNLCLSIIENTKTTIDIVSLFIIIHVVDFVE
jgi:hypothetical protein